MQVVTSLLTSCNNLSQQTDVRMHLQGLRQQVSCKLSTGLLQVVNRPVASCQQTCCKLISSTGKLSTNLLQLVSTSCNKSANDKLQQAQS